MTNEMRAHADEKDRKEERENDAEKAKPGYPAHIVPSLLFIIPYRDREDDLTHYQHHMVQVMDTYPQHSYRFIVVHQNDDRSFNRGAIKNIGFLWARRKYPHHYRRITFVFHDVDTVPVQRHCIPWHTSVGTIRHFYGYRHALGGIFSITGADFETLGGFPNYWGYGYEDNMLNRRALAAGITISRDPPFFDLQWVQPGPAFRPDKVPILATTFHQRNHGFERVLNRDDHSRFTNNDDDGVRHLTRVHLVEEEIDDLFLLLHVSDFQTKYQENPDQQIVHDLRQGLSPFSSTTSHHHHSNQSSHPPLSQPASSGVPSNVFVTRRMFRHKRR